LLRAQKCIVPAAVATKATCLKMAHSLLAFAIASMVWL
jgi:hypothetical protein